MLTIIFIFLLLTLLFIKIVQTQKYWSRRGVIHGSLLQDFVRVFIKRESFCEALIRVYTTFPNSSFVGLSQTLLPDLVLTNIDLIKEICIKDFDHFTDHRWFIPDGVDELWSKNLFALKGIEWKHMRTTLSPCFTSNKMKILFNLIAECSQTHLEFYSNKISNIKTVELSDIFTRYTTDIIATVAFGLKSDSITNKNNDFYVMGEKSTSFGFSTKIFMLLYTIMPAIPKMLGLTFLNRKVSEIFKRTVNDTIKLIEEKGIFRPDMIHILLEARKHRIKEDENQTINENEFAVVNEMLKGGYKKPFITNNDIASQAVIFFFAGFHTVSVLLCFMAYELALNPQIQKRLQQEIDETLNKCKGKINYESLIGMKYMDMVVTETFRKWPPVIGVDRACTKKYTFKPTNNNEKSLKIYPGELIWIPVGAIHRDPKFYPNPDEFKPERFNEYNKDKIKPYTFLPFGLGPRNCIGSRLALLEIKMFFFFILTKFEFVPNQKTDKNLKLKKSSFNLLEAKEIWVDLKLRDL
nr:cytochrome P450 9e2-like [Onthophagus taurus]